MNNFAPPNQGENENINYIHQQRWKRPAVYSSVLKEWSLRAFTDAIKPIESRYLLSVRNLIGFCLLILVISVVSFLV